MMRPDLPKQVQVGPFLWKVDSGAKATLELAKSADYGETDLDTLTIRVRSDVHPDVARETLLHELIHAAFAVSALSDWPSEQQEQVCRALAPLLLPHMVVSEPDSQVG